MKTWHERMVARLKGEEKLMPWFLHDKIRCHDWSVAHGFETPAIYRRFSSPDSIVLEVDEDAFVLKPTRFSSTIGVMALSREGDKYFDALSQKSYTAGEVVENQILLHEKNPLKENKWIIEEMVVDAAGHAAPLDIKAYAFRGEIALLLVIDRNVRPTRVDWYDGDFRPLAPGRITLNPKYVQPGSASLPPNASAVKELAAEISRTVGTPFARIDLYSSTRGPVLGEVTLTPGGLYYGDHYSLSEEQDHLMGAMWQCAEADSDVVRDSISELLFSQRLAELTAAQVREVNKIFWNPYLIRSLVDK